MKTLRDVKIGETAKVVKLHGEGPVKRRIMDMGITKGTEPAQGGHRNDRSTGIIFCYKVRLT